MVESLERLTFVIVDEVPTLDTAEPNKLYLVDTNHDGMYEEYILAEIDGEPTIVELGPVVDLSGYYDKIQIDNLLLTKQNVLSWDNTIAANGTNPVVSGVIYSAISKLINDVAQLENGNLQLTTVDGTTSVIQTDTAVTNTNKLIQSKAVYAAIQQLEQAMESIHIELTQAQYDALQTVDPNIEYFVTDAVAEGDFSNIEGRLQDIEDAVISSYTCEALYVNSGSTNPATITLASDIANYSFLIFTTQTTGYEQTNQISVDDLELNDAVTIYNQDKAVTYIVSDDDTLTLDTDTGATIIRIDGYVEKGAPTLPIAGYEETVLYTASSPHTNNIELSQAYTNFDEIAIVWKYSIPDPDTADNYSVRYTNTYKVSTFGDSVVFLCGEETSSDGFTAYMLDDTTHINYNSKTGTYYNWISKVIGIKYKAPAKLGAEDTVLWENEGTSSPSSVTLSDAWTNYDELYFFMNGAAAPDKGNAVYLTSDISINDELAVRVNDATYNWWSPTSNTTFAKTGGSQNGYLRKITGRKIQKVNVIEGIAKDTYLLVPPGTTPTKIEGNNSSIYRSEQSIILEKSYKYNPQISGYIDVSQIIPSSILNNGDTDINLGVVLAADYTLTITLQMYIGSTAPTENDWVTVISHQVTSSQSYDTGYISVKASEINPSLSTDGKLYFRMIHGEEHSAYTAYATIYYLVIKG